MYTHFHNINMQIKLLQLNLPKMLSLSEASNCTIEESEAIQKIIIQL